MTTLDASSAPATAPRLTRLLPRRDAAATIGAFLPLLEGYLVRVEDASGTLVVEEGAAAEGAAGGGAGAAWRADLVAYGATVGTLLVSPAPTETRAGFAVEALRDGLQRMLTAAAGRRELVAETLERYREVNLLYRLGDVLGGTLDPAALPERLLAEALRLIPADGAALVVDPDGDAPGASATAGSLPAGRLLALLESTRTALVDDARPAILAGATPRDATTAIRVWVPLRARERTLGGVLLTRPAAAAIFTAGDEKLLSALATQGAAYLDNARLHQRSLAQARMAQELQLAHDVQARLMPRVMPERPGWRVAASWRPAREVAGDFFDATLNGDDVAVAVGDVADKGMAAALFMALTRSVLRASAAPGRGPGEVVARANALLCADATDGMFVTLAYAVLEPGGAVRYANAGHNPPLLIRADGSVERLGRTGILVGWDPDVEFGEARVELAAGDVLVLYTDGVTEALDAHGHEYGEERFERTAVRHRSDGAAGALRALLDDLAAFVGEALPYDDATLLIATYEGPPG